MRQLPPRPDLAHLKAQAKDLLRDYRAGDRAAFDRLRGALPAGRGLDDAALAQRGLRLHDAQSCVAREYGFASWSDLKAYVEWHAVRGGDRDAVLRRWLRLVYGGENDAPRPALAERVLDEPDDLRRADPYLACAVGDEAIVRDTIARDPGWVNRAGGPLGMPPLLAVTLSGLVRLPRFAAGLRSCARILLDAGADREATWVDDAFASPLGALYGAAGKNHDAELTRMLLDAGADPNDGESLYHAVASADLTCAHLLLEAGAKVTGTNALFRMLDFDDVAGLQLLLQHGADPNEVSGGLDRPLHHAIRRGRSLAHVETLLTAGADPSAKTSTGVSVALLASRHGRDDVLRRLGLHEPLPVQERFVAACARADRNEAAAILAAEPDVIAELSAEQLRQLPVLAAEGRRDAVETMIEMGWPIGVHGGDWNASALNVAVFRGDAALTKFLLDHGASWTERHGYGDDVTGTLSFASGNRPVANGDWLGCAHELIAHGMPVPPPSYEFSDEVADYLAGAARVHVAPDETAHRTSSCSCRDGGRSSSRASTEE